MRRWSLLFLPMVLGGCHARGLSDLTGAWTSTKGTDFTFDGSTTFQATVHRNGKDTPETGVVSMAGDRVTLTLTTIKGQPIGDLKAKLERRAATLTPRLRAITATLGQSEVFLLSPDGRTLTKQGVATPYELRKR